MVISLLEVEAQKLRLDAISSLKKLYEAASWVSESPEDGREIRECYETVRAALGAPTTTTKEAP